MIAAMAAAAILGRLEGRPFGVYGLPARKLSVRASGRASFGESSMITAMIFLIRLLGGFSFGELALHGSALWRYAALWGLVFLCVGFFEEFLFRGYAQFTLATGLEFWPAATMLSAAFGALHLANGGEDKVGALSVFVIGMFFCLTLRRTGNLWFAVGLHASFDWGETFLFSVPNSGIVAPGHLLNSSFHGPAWLTGGTVGPEGSVMAFVVLAVRGGDFQPCVSSKEGWSGGEAMSSELLIIEALERAPALVIPLIQEVPQPILKRRPKPGKWSAHEHACHLAAVHPLMTARLDLMLAQERPRIQPYLPHLEDEDDALLKLDLAEAMDRFSTDRQRLVGRLKSLSAADW